MLSSSTIFLTANINSFVSYTNTALILLCTTSTTSLLLISYFNLATVRMADNIARDYLDTYSPTQEMINTQIEAWRQHLKTVKSPEDWLCDRCDVDNRKRGLNDKSAMFCIDCKHYIHSNDKIFGGVRGYAPRSAGMFWFCWRCIKEDKRFAWIPMKYRFCPNHPTSEFSPWNHTVARKGYRWTPQAPKQQVCRNCVIKSKHLQLCALDVAGSRAGKCNKCFFLMEPGVWQIDAIQGPLVILDKEMTLE